MVTPLATTPEAKTTAAETASLEREGPSSLTQHPISQPKRLMGSWGMPGSPRICPTAYINGVKAVYSE